MKEQCNACGHVASTTHSPNELEGFFVSDVNLDKHDDDKMSFGKFRSIYKFPRYFVCPKCKMGTPMNEDDYFMSKELLKKLKRETGHLIEAIEKTGHRVKADETVIQAAVRVIESFHELIETIESSMKKSAFPRRDNESLKSWVCRCIDDRNDLDLVLRITATIM